MSRSPVDWRTVLLAGLCLALVGLLFAEIRSRPQFVLPPPEVEMQAGVSSEQPPELPVFEPSEPPIAAALERPLFSPGRSPVSLAAPVEQTPTTAGFSLIGIAISPDERVAVLVPVGGGSPTRLREGESYDGWSAVSIESDHVVLRQAGVEERLYLQFNLPAPAAAPSAAGAAEATSEQQQPWSGGDPPDRFEADPTMEGGDGNATP